MKNIPERFFKEKKWDRLLPVEATYFQWFTVLGNIELSLRHPKNIGPSSPVIREFAKQLAERLIDELPDTFTEEVIALTNWRKTFKIER